jgi:hypothetical protein
MSWNFDLHGRRRSGEIFTKMERPNPKTLLELGKLKRFIIL